MAPRPSWRKGEIMHVAICGGGVIGAAAAHELSRRGADVTLIERWKIGGSASGRSGGFLARDWCDGTPVAELAHRSFDLHEAWAEQLGNPYGYRKIDTYSAVMSARAQGAVQPEAGMADWLSPAAQHRRQLGNASTTAQLDPEAFTKTLAEAAVRQGATLVMDAVAGLNMKEGSNTVSGVALESGRQITAEAVILALGPWSLLATQWLPLPLVYGLKGYSIIFKPDKPVPAEAVFAEIQSADGIMHTPEIVSRADGTIYVCGLPSTDNLPVDPSQVKPEKDGIDELRDMAVQLVPRLKSASIVAEQACYRPVTADGLPLIGAIRDYANVYVATGHSVWGMLNAPGTAEALAQLLLDGETSEINLAPFDPNRLAPVDPGDVDVRAR
jgi:glycine/D-amino acid oxidase-like deaminating enzyme